MIISSPVYECTGRPGVDSDASISKILKFCIDFFLCNGQDAARLTILYADGSCFYYFLTLTSVTSH